MPIVQILSYSFNISHPYAEGHVCSEAEAKALNAQRTDRIRNIIYKRLQNKSNSGALMAPAELAAFEAEVAELDQGFNFVSHNYTNRILRNTLQGEIWEVAKEAARSALRQKGGEPTDEEVETIAESFASDSNIVEEGRRRYEAFQEMSRKALADLMS